MNKVYSIIVLYNPEEDSLVNIYNIIQLSEKTFIVVNSCSKELLDEIKKLNGHVIVNLENIGLSKALNIGLKECLKEDACTHIALFDQDSIPASDSFKILLQTLLDNPGKIAAIGPLINDVKNKPDIHPSVNVVKEVNVIISSGSLMPTYAIKDIGLMDETLFIDYIDYEWCFRAKSKGYKILQNTNAILYHNMGNSFVNFLGGSKPMHKNKLRHYYIIRNQLIFISRHYVPIKYRIIHFIKLFYRIPAYLLLSDDSRLTWIMIRKAFRDFFSNKQDYLKIKF